MKPDCDQGAAMLALSAALLLVGVLGYRALR